MAQRYQVGTLLGGLDAGDAGDGAILQEIPVADITIFDPDTVTDNATYKMGENGRPSTGIPYVLVNGTIMVRDSKVVDGVFPGQSIRFEPEATGRFEPLAKESYLENLLAPDLPIDEGIGSAAAN